MTASADDVNEYLESVLDVLRLIPNCPQGWTDDCRPSAKAWIERQLAQEKCIDTLVDAARAVFNAWDSMAVDDEMADRMVALSDVIDAYDLRKSQEGAG